MQQVINFTVTVILMAVMLAALKMQYESMMFKYLERKKNNRKETK